MKKLYLLTSLILLCCVQMANAQNNKINDDYHPLVQEGKIWSVLNAIWHPSPDPNNPMGYYTYSTEKFMFYGDITHGLSSVMARSVLCFFYEICLEEVGGRRWEVMMMR